MEPIAIRAVPRPALRSPWRAVAAVAGALLLGALALLTYVTASGGTYRPVTAVELPSPPTLDKQLPTLERRLAALAPRGIVVRVDTYHNRLEVLRDGKLLREAVCSTGSGTVLRDPRTGKEWVFDTPLGERKVQRKVRNPVWIKPDWAFVENGFEPPKDGRERVDDISLGDYALYLGDGYIIHGTLFQTLLGQSLTHGCIRLGDDDLEFVFRQVPLGSTVLLY